MLATPARTVVLLLAAALSLAACERPQSNAKSQAPPAPPPAPVVVATPLKQRIAAEDEFVGRFVAVDSVEVKARVSGYLAAVQFKDGQMVAKGAPLFTIDRRPFEITLDQAKANLQQAESNLALAEADLVRARDLVVGSTISKQTLDQRQAAKRGAEAAVLAQAAAVRQATLDLEFTELKAPVAGRIGDRRVSVGNFVTAATTASSTLLASIQSIDPIRFEFTLDEAAYLRFERARGAGHIAKDQVPVRLKLLDEADFKHEGRLDFIDNALSRSSGTIRGRAELANPAGLFAPGMFARLRIALTPPADALLVPDAAIGSEQVRKFVLVVGDDNVAKPRYVRTGVSKGTLRVIEEGLSATDRVVIDGLMKVRPGMKVVPTVVPIVAAAPDAAGPAKTRAD